MLHVVRLGLRLVEPNGMRCCGRSMKPKLIEFVIACLAEQFMKRPELASPNLQSIFEEVRNQRACCCRVLQIVFGTRPFFFYVKFQPK